MRKILIVDDIGTNRRILGNILRESYEVVEAENGREALAALRAPNAEIAAVVLDIVMPVMDGFEMLAEMRRDAAFAHIPVLVSTENAGGEAEARALALGASDFIVKPYKAELIRQRIKNLIRLTDVTGDIERLRAEKEALRISEERYRIAASAGGRVTARYDIKTGTYYRSDDPLTTLGFGKTVENVPQTFVAQKVVAPECTAEYLAFYARMRNGAKSTCVDIAISVSAGVYRWFHCEATVIFEDDGSPSQAIIVYTDITEQREKETVYKKWQQALRQRDPQSFTLFRCNLSRNESYETQEGLLLKAHTQARALTFNTQTREYALQFVYPDDRETYMLTVNSDVLLANYHRNRRMEVLDYRELLPENQVRWLRLTIELVEYPNASDVEAYLMYEDINEQKLAELKAKEMAERDPLTGVLNRAAFTERAEQAMAGGSASTHALLMLDIDCFKQLNDAFGHAAGDQELIDIAATLRSVLRSEDLVGRLGGDEFVLFMRDVPYDAVIAKKARQICAVIRKAFNTEVQISASVGIAVYPRDGRDFDSLYRCADIALYSVKNAGKDSFAFFDHSVHDRPAVGRAQASEPPEHPAAAARARRRILIVDDNELNREMLANMFRDEYLIETASDGLSAMMRLRHYGTSISVVLLDLLMPGMDGFAVLEKMHENLETRSIPVIVVSGQNERETSLRAIKAGATDYVTKPVDPDLIRLRVESAVRKAESERLRAQNNYLLLQSSEEAKYRTVLDSTGTVVIEFDWMGGVFTYDDSISDYIAGTYNDRRLWQILLSDLVADTADVQAMQELVRSVADDRRRGDGDMTVRLRTPAGGKQWFRMRVFKRADEFQLTNKLIITYVNINEEVLAEEKLRFQAERDELTGLWNRKTFFEKAADMIAARKPGYYVVACYDIDNFKVINDQFGSEKGDEILIRVAEILQSGFEAAGGLVARITADNFAVLYPVSFLQSDRLREIREACRVPDSSVPPITFRIGRYIADDASLSVSAMYDRATLAQASVRGRFDVNIAQYDESMRDQLLQQQMIVNEMNRALEEGQFEVWFQPQYNHSTGARIGAEALVRWRHPQRGLLPPGEFIPIFERNGFIYELDKYVWEQTCADLRRWSDEGRSPLPVAVNISRYDLFRSDLCDIMTGLLQKYALPAGLLRLEITESAFAQDSEQIVAVAKRLIDDGFTVEIDDFGSGYSSLNTLKDVPAQVLKMDMRFLERSENSDRGGNILESVVRMAKWLGMAVIAEGVESKKQADYLKSIGCSYVQGYLYARPMPAADYVLHAAGGGKEEQLLVLETVENYDNNAFWNPDSMDTLIFNTYVGGACIFEWNKQRIEILRANDKYAKVIGGETCTVDDAMHLVWEDHMDAAAARATCAAIERTIATGEDATYEAAYRDLFDVPGETWLRTTFRVIARTADRYLIYATNINLTQQRRAERRTSEALEQLQAIMSSVTCGITAVTVDGTAVDYLFVNDRYYEILGYTREQYAAEVASAFDLLHPEDRARVIAETNGINASAETTTLEYRVLRRDGRVAWVRNSVSVTHFAGMARLVQLGISTDITQEMETAQRIRALNENLQNMMDDMPGGFARLRVLPDGDYATEYVNDSFCRLRGMPRAEILAQDGAGAAHIVHPDDVDALRSAVRELLADGGVRRLQYRLRHAGGQYIPLTVFGRASKNEAGDTIINAYFAEMTEREKRDMSIRETLPFLLSAIMRSSTDLSFAKDRSLTYLCCSKAFAKMVGLESEADVVGKTDYDLFPDSALAEQYRADDFRLMERGESLIDYVEPIPSEDGLQHFSSTSKYILRDTAGDIIGIYGTGRDVTEYRTAFERLKLLTDSIPGGLITYVLAPEGLRVAYFNDGLCKLFGCTREEYAAATKNGVITTVFPEDIPRLQAQIARMIRDGTPVDCTYRIRNMKNSGYKWVNLRATPAELRGGTLQANAVLYDVTEQKLAAEAALVHEAEMRLAISQLGKVICEYDPRSRVLTMPEAYAAELGAAAVVEDVPEGPIRSGAVNADMVEEYRKFYAAIQRGARSGSAELRDRRADGSLHWKHIEFSQIFDADDKPLKAIITVEDTTEQHARYELEQARPTLGEQNLLVHALFDLHTGETLDYTYADGSAVPRAERTAFQRGGDNLETMLVNEGERACYRALNDPQKLLERFENGETELSLDYRRRLRSGEIVWVRNLLRMVRKPGGSNILLFEYCYNIEEEKTRELMYGTLVHDSYDFVARINANSGQFAVIARAGGGFGMPPQSGDDVDAAVRAIAAAYIHPEDRARLLENACVAGMKRNLAQHDRHQFAYRIVDTDGALLYKKLTVYYLDREREILLAAREDVSELVRAEIRKNEQLSEALAAAEQAGRARNPRSGDAAP